jgi:hypothetical protein
MYSVDNPQPVLLLTSEFFLASLPAMLVLRSCWMMTTGRLLQDGLRA